jgi:hypothetical protein
VTQQQLFLTYVNNERFRPAYLIEVDRRSFTIEIKPPLIRAGSNKPHSQQTLIQCRVNPTSLFKWCVENSIFVLLYVGQNAKTNIYDQKVLTVKEYPRVPESFVLSDAVKDFGA